MDIKALRTLKQQKVFSKDGHCNHRNVGPREVVLETTFTTLPKASANSANVTLTKSSAFTPGIFLSPTASSAMITSYPLSAACLAVVLTQTCAIYPVKTILFFPDFFKNSSRSVPVKDPGCCF